LPTTALSPRRGAGLIVGLAGAGGVTRVLQRFLFGVTPADPIASTIVTLLLMAVGLIAAWLPARRATRIDPCAARGIAVTGSDPSVE
jgi:ABC-type antimicrobial peptide transport system permease subunit